MENPKICTYKMFKRTIIFDWDDTLLCSQYLTNKKCRLNKNTMPVSVISVLEELDVTVVTLLSNAIKNADVIILSNGERKWVEESCQRYLPKSWKIVMTLDIYSGYDYYSKLYDNCLWKVLTLREHIKDRFLISSNPEDEYEIISIGDAFYEKEAVTFFVKTHPGYKAKTVYINCNRCVPKNIITSLKLINKVLTTILESKDEEFEIIPNDEV